MDEKYYAARLRAAAHRMVRLIDLNAPKIIIVREKEILDNQYSEWKKRAFVSHDAPKKVQ